MENSTIVWVRTRTIGYNPMVMGNWGDWRIHREVHEWDWQDVIAFNTERERTLFIDLMAEWLKAHPEVTDRNEAAEQSIAHARAEFPERFKALWK